MQIRPTGPCPAIVERIFARTIQSDTGCKLWQGGADSRGYGMIYFEGRAHYTHRLVYAALCGILKPGEVVRHKCDTPRCCEPSHLISGSKGDNIRDAFKRGQLKKAIPDTAVRQLRSGDLSIKEASTLYGITAKYAYNIKLGHKRASCK